MDEEFASVRWDRDSTINNNTATKSAQTPPRSPAKSSGLSSPSNINEILTSNAGAPKDETRSQGAIHKREHSAVESMSDKYKVNEEDNTVFVTSVVSSPQKESDGQNAYISYLIETHTNDPLFKTSRLKVRRRFSDFYFLYQCLINDFPACALPPLPDKQRLEYLKGDRFGWDFTSKRASSLTRFLRRMSLHPVLKRSKIYHIFLESSDWNSYKDSLNVAHAQKHNNENNEGEFGNLNPVSDSISDIFMNAFKHPQAQPNKEFVEINERCNKLNDNVIKIDKSFQKYIKRLGDLGTNFQSFAELVVKLDELESSNSLTNENNQGVDGTTKQRSDDPVIKNQPIMKPLPSIKDESDRTLKNSKFLDESKSSSYVKFSKGLENLSIGLNQLKTYLDNDYLISLKDLENYIYSIKNLIKVKEQKQIDFEALSEYLARAIQEKNQLLQQTGGQFTDDVSSLATPHSTTSVAKDPSITLPTPKPSTLTTLAANTSNFLSSKLDDIRGINSMYQKKERLIKLSVKIETLEREVVNAKQIFEVFENEILHEMQYFDVIKSNELKYNLSDLTSNYIGFYKNIINDWEKIEKSLESDINDYNKRTSVE
ncbi:Snx4 protein [Saccharomycopsis crataegensis]|uniref:Sorting nexin-4 n=1 Tax=Saccharomycopsis crataegensis TaxID=43959 RepID=A0AAV5QKL2_9ASCO|nr:Snx4 protein [Saccharomycopsis crataegensis]